LPAFNPCAESERIDAVEFFAMRFGGAATPKARSKTRREAAFLLFKTGGTV
jgi:hypothetical protein